MCEERVIETLLAAIARRDETIREGAATLAESVRREERDRAEVSDLREQIEDFRKRLTVCREESENRRRQLHENAKGLAFALAIAEYRAHDPEVAEQYVRVDRYTCPECLEPSGRCSRQCDACHAQSSDYCTAPNCIRNPGHTGPCRGFA